MTIPTHPGFGAGIERLTRRRTPQRIPVRYTASRACSSWTRPGARSRRSASRPACAPSANWRSSTTYARAAADRLPAQTYYAQGTLPGRAIPTRTSARRHGDGPGGRPMCSATGRSAPRRRRRSPRCWPPDTRPSAAVLPRRHPRLGHARPPAPPAMSGEAPSGSRKPPPAPTMVPKARPQSPGETEQDRVSGRTPDGRAHAGGSAALEQVVERDPAAGDPVGRIARLSRGSAGVYRLAPECARGPRRAHATVHARPCAPPGTG